MIKKIEFFLILLMFFALISISVLAKTNKVDQKNQEAIMIQQVKLLKLGLYELLESAPPFDVKQLIGQRLSSAEFDCLGGTIEDYYRKLNKRISVNIKVLDRSQGKLAIIFKPERPSTVSQSTPVYITNYCMLGVARLNKDFTSIPEFQNSFGNPLSLQQLNFLGNAIDRFYQERGRSTRTTVRVLNHERGIAVVNVVENQSVIEKSVATQPSEKSVATRPFEKSVTTQPSTSVVDRSAKIRSIRFSGNTLFTTQELLKLPEAVALMNKPVSDVQVKSLERAISKMYHRQGYMLAQSYTKQLAQAVLEVQIFEGVIDSIVVDNRSNYDEAVLHHYARNTLCGNSTENCSGQVIHKKSLERMIGLIGDLPGAANVKSTLLPGSKQGSTNLKVSVEKGDELLGYASVDNYGSKSTGKNRLTGGMIANNLASVGDQVVLEATTTNEKSNIIGQIGYGIPMGHDGARVGINYTRSQYYLGGDFKDLESKGFSNKFSLWGSYPFIRSQASNLSGRVSFDYSTPRNFFFGKEVSSAKAQGISVGVSGQFSDDLILAKSYNNYGLTLLYSKVKTNSTNVLINAQTKNSTRMQWNLSRNQGIMGVGQSGRISAYLSLRGQHTQKSLDSSDRFSLGGASGVRAYPAGEGVGDIGTIASFEFRYNVYLAPQIPGFLTMALFYDRGTHKNVEKVNGSDNKETFEGTGVSLNLSLLDQWTLDFVLAKRKKNSPPILTEENAKDTRFWVRGGVRF